MHFDEFKQMFDKNNETTLSCRYMIALKEICNNKNIHLSPSNKGSEIIIMDIHAYQQKMKFLLKDNIYEKINKNEVIIVA